jgi:hypothetical protein
MGVCTECGSPVCARCGNIQLVRGERRCMHDACLKKADGGFSMIKFVK